MNTEAPQRRPLSPARRWVLGVGMVLSLLLIAYGVLLLVNLLGRTSEERRSALPATGDRLVVSSSGGSVRVVGRGVDEVHVVAKLRYGLGRPRVEQTSGPDGVRLSASCRWYSSFCSTDWEIEVPARFAVDADSSGGSITVQAVAGAVTADSSGGGITVRDARGAVRASSSGGDITVAEATGAVDLKSSGGGVTGERLRGAEARAESSGGDVRLGFATAPERVEASSSGGGVEIRLPPVEGGYRVDASSSGGDRSVDVPTDPASARRIRATSSGGDVRILPASPA
jgi:hypothetical protein